ncbi:MAG: hypothetical protein QXH08_00365 [Candidatus Hadarchaeales archaeon]
MTKIKLFKVEKCQFRSFLNPFRLKLRIGKYRIHHGYIGSAISAVGASWGMRGKACWHGDHLPLVLWLRSFRR